MNTHSHTHNVLTIGLFLASQFKIF